MVNKNLSVGAFGDEVTDLHDKLVAQGFDIPPAELDRQFFGPATRDAVRKSQQDQGLPVTGIVDSQTATKIGLIDSPVATPKLPPQESTGTVVAASPMRAAFPSAVATNGVASGAVAPVPSLSSSGRELVKPVTPPLRRNDQGEDVVNLQECLLLLLEKQVIQASERDQQLFQEVLKREQQIQVYSDVTAKLVGQFQEQYSTRFHLTVTGEVDAPTANALNSFLKDLGAFHPNQDGVVFEVKGKVVSRVSASIGGLRIVIVDKGVGGDVQLAETTTTESGTYLTSFSDSEVRRRGKAQPDLQARVFAGEIFLGASEVHYNATQHETLHVLLEDQAAAALRSEHEVLTSALTNHVKGKLGDLKETDEQQDVTYLANKTGWDARAVAMAALADQFSARTATANGTPAISQHYFYALFRAGLPANEDTLYHTDAKMLQGVWQKAAEQGVIAKASTEELQALSERFQTISAQKLLTAPALVGASSLKEMLIVSRLEESQQSIFAQLYATNRSDMLTFWNAVSSTFGQDVANRLQVDGKLGFLTINNAPLMQKIHTTAGDNGLSDPLQLAQTGYHRFEAWSKLLTADVSIPQEIPGDTPETKRTNYASYLAAQVRLSYPTASVAQMVKSGELPLTGAANGISDQVHTFLSEHQGKFEIGVHPVQQYIAQNHVQVADETVQQVKRLQRVYQITPSDQALSGLMKRGIDAAYHVVRYDKDTFVQSFAADVGGAEHAALIHDRSVQVHNVVLNIVLGYLTARTAPAIGVHSPPSVLDPTPANAGDVIPMATLESLFGSMDFCTCDHCRSILSPAAYLVDLLLFLNSDTDVWADYLKSWKQNHANAPYPFIDQNAWKKFQKDWNDQHPGQLLPNTEISPFDVLMSRRPDIQHLPLTCENTNTALPYIDVVNETLEYYIANNSQKLSLKNYLGHDTNDTASEDLLASPQSFNEGVRDDAYTILRNEHFPALLPFHQPLEMLRRYFNKFEVPLPLAMERLRKTDELERGANSYGWRDILMEEIGLSRAEYEILTDSTAVPLWQLYGFPNGTADAEVIAGLSNAKQFARRVGITYDDLISILKTRFINPHSDLIPKLERLGVDFAMLAELKTKNDAPTNEKFDALLAALAVPPDPAEYGGAPNAPKNDYTPIRAWVKDNDNYARIMGLTTLTDPTGNPDLCNFDNFEFRYAKPMAGVGDTSTRLGAVEFVRLLRFLRLWKKLGWTVEQTDAAICALYPSPTPPETFADTTNTVAKLDAGFLTLLPRLGVISRVMKALNLTVKRDLLSLLACWSEIGTHGATALYYQMFLNPALLEQDAVFADNGYGEFLQDNAQKLLAHAEALRSAFNLTGDEFDLIINALGFNTVVDVPYTHPQPSLEQLILSVGPGIGYDHQQKRLSYIGLLDAAVRDAFKSVAGVTADFQTAVEALYQASQAALRPLTLADASAIYRRAWLARTLKLSVRELLLLIRLTDLDPFALPDPTNPAILRLIAFVQALEDRSLKSVALYLIWNQDLSGKSAPDPAQIAELARTLRGDFASIEDQFAAIEDPNDDVARAQITLVYGQETGDAFFALLDDTLVVDVAYTHSAPALEPAITVADPRIAYDDFRHRLSHRGLVITAMQTTLKNVNGVSGDFQKAVDALFARSEDAKGSFFARNKELQPGYDNVLAWKDTLRVDYSQPAPTLETAITAADNRITYDNTKHQLSYSGRLTWESRDLLKTVPSVTPEFQAAVDALFALSQKARGEAVLATLRPELSRRRKRQQALQRLSAAAAVSLEFTQLMLNPTSEPYSLHADGDQNKPALDDVLALETPGLTAQFFFRDTATGNVDQSIPAAAKLAYAMGGSNPLPNPGTAVSGIWSGQVETPEAGFYNFIIEADSGAKVELTLDGQVLTLTQNGNVRRNTDSLELKAGMLYKVELKVEKVKDALSFKWETPKRTREVIPSRFLYPSTLLAPFSSAYVRFLKAASLATGLGLTANELAYVATYADYRINAQGQLDINGQGWLNALPNADNLHLTNPADAAVAKNLNAALLTPLCALLDFARIKAEISPGDESLVVILKDPTTATQNTDSPLFTITRWNQPSLNDVLARFGGNIAGLGHFDLFRRVYDAFALVQKMGISVKALIQATTNEPTGDIVRGFQGALRARYDAADWRDVVRPINDETRSLQRDALVAYILHQMRSHPASAHIDTPDKLFEYFLMDVQMDPCMQTSRIRHALSSVQLFIERCLMNLEPRVSPAAVNAKQWEWMKRYRVWEANRKVFLFPENWLEPELRDDKSPFFKEIESELLQSDITDDSAATAILNYLSKLDEVAKLEPCGIYHIPRDDGKRTPEINHVVARTAGAHRKYYYRRYEDVSWTPWEQIKLDIEDNPVIPVVWNDRLFLFWLRILKKGPDTAQKPPADKNLTALNTKELPTDPPITVQAVLSWSEYYNGKWQPTKTSDINRPTSLLIDFRGRRIMTHKSHFERQFAPAEFDRSKLWLSVSQASDGLCIDIQGEGHSSFFLYNTHSLPLREDEHGYDVVPDPRHRDLDTSTNTFTIRYYSGMGGEPPTRTILQNALRDSIITPQHPLQNSWDAPFFYEDSRHVFYVTTTERPVPIPYFGKYGVHVDPGIKQVAKIPPLVLKIDPEVQVKPTLWGDGGPIGPDPGVIDTGSMKRLVTEDAYIRHGIGTTAVVMYGDKKIEPSGAVMNIQAGK